jgi:DNA-binding NarL/FixJ family response regulator
MPPIRILIADDHPLLRSGLRLLIGKQADMQLVAEATNGTQAIALAAEHRPDVAVIDLTMPELDGVKATEQISRQAPETNVLALTMHEAVPFLRSFLAAGGMGYLLKRSVDSELLRAIRAVARGRRYIDSKLGTVLVAELSGEFAGNRAVRAELSERENEVVRLLAQGYSNQEISEQMGVSVKTVESYRARVAQKLGLRTRPEIVRYALTHGLLRPEDFAPSG